MGNNVTTCGGLCGGQTIEENQRGEIRNSFLQKDLQVETEAHGKDEMEEQQGKQPFSLTWV